MVVIADVSRYVNRKSYRNDQSGHHNRVQIGARHGENAKNSWEMLALKIARGKIPVMILAMTPVATKTVKKSYMNTKQTKAMHPSVAAAA